MKRCPTCDAVHGDEAVSCVTCGGGLYDAPDTVSPAAASAPDFGEVTMRDAPTLVPWSTCPACRMPNTDDGEGTCSSCGEELDQRLTVSILPPGATFGGCTVTGARAADDVTATSKAGDDVLLAVGDAQSLADEASATRALAGHPAAGKLIEVGDDPRRGPFLILSALPPGSMPLAEVASSLTLEAALAMAREVLALTISLERSGHRWIPRPSDFYMKGQRLVLSRVRAAKLEGGRADACCPLATFGRALLPVPALGGTPALFRLFAGPGLDAPHELRDADAIRAALDAASAELARAPSDPIIASLCDGGLKRPHNEDAVAVAAGESKGSAWSVLVVCDGVSCSTNAEQASAVASQTACDELATFARSGEGASEEATRAMHSAIRAAHLAVCSAQIEHGNKEPPGTTIVAGLVFQGRLTVGWVGDSRAYWVGEEGGELLTRDHSWAQETVARGEMTEEDAMMQPLAHALTRCLGPLEGGDSDEAFATVQPDVCSRELSGPGHVVLCTDGLWNYFPDARMIAALLASAGGDATCEAIARRLVANALYRGGGDNVSVAVYRWP